MLTRVAIHESLAIAVSNEIGLCGLLSVHGAASVPSSLSVDVMGRPLNLSPKQLLGLQAAGRQLAGLRTARSTG